MTAKLIDKISVVILTKDEEAGIAATLERVKSFTDVIVVDSQSEDKTASIATETGARVVQFTWNGSYPKKKQWSLEHSGARNSWVLLLDADEYPNDELLKELQKLQHSLEDSEFSAFDILLSYRFAGRLLTHGHTVTKRSLLDTRATKFPNVHDEEAPGIREVEGHYQPESEGRVGHLSGRLIHDDRDPVRSWFDRHNRYSDWEAFLRIRQELRREVASKRTLKGRIFDKFPLKPALFFLYSYIARLGFLDGRAGFDYAFALSAYYWQIGVKVRELRRDQLAS